MAVQKCENCGRELPPELGQHSVAPMSGLVICPHCGAEVHLERPAEAAGGAGAESAKPTGAESGAAGTRGGEQQEVAGATSTPERQSAPESFSGNETMEELKEELESKQEGDAV